MDPGGRCRLLDSPGSGPRRRLVRPPVPASPNSAFRSAGSATRATRTGTHCGSAGILRKVSLSGPACHTMQNHSFCAAGSGAELMGGPAPNGGTSGLSMRRSRPYRGPERRAVRSACRLVAPTTAAAMSAASTALLPWLFAVLSAARSAHGRAEQARKDRLCARFCQRH